MSTPAFAESMERGVSAHEAGRVEEALACYRAALSIKPDDAEAISLCGLALVHRGAPAEALPLLLRAVELEPDQPGFRLNLAEGLAQANDRERALHELRTVLVTEPGNVRAWQRLHALQGEELAGRRDWPALQVNAAAWIRKDPQSKEAWRSAARAAFEQGRHIEACNAFERVLTLATPSAADLTAYAGLCLHALNIDSAKVALDKAEALDPEYAQMLSNRALLCMYLGHFEESESYCRRCVAKDPDYAPAYTTLSRLQRGRLSDADLAAVTGIAHRADIHLDYRISAAFANAHAHDARDDIDSAFAAYEYAHSLALERDKQENRGYDPAQVEERTNRILSVPDASSAFGTASAPGAPRPIFIIGMPRSGTTLIEGVLAAHSRVFACGERSAMQQLLRAWLGEAGRAPGAHPAREWATAYFAGLPGLGGADHVTDKHPLNFEAAGLIAELFPDAPIVHVRRNPMETCLSIYRQEFSKHWSFAHRLEDIGHFYGHYARLVAHWERSLPRFTTIRYEHFVEHFELAAPELVQACGLAWEPQCLEFQRTPRAIATFSTVQARDPVRPGTRRAKRYERHLSPLIAALENAGVDPETGDMAGRATG